MRAAGSPGVSLSCVRSPVKRMKSGRGVSELTMATARSKAAAPVGLGGPEKPTWVSESCTKENGWSASPLARAWLRARSIPAAVMASAGATRYRAPAPSERPVMRRKLRRSMAMAGSKGGPPP